MYNVHSQVYLQITKLTSSFLVLLIAMKIIIITIDYQLVEVGRLCILLHTEKVGIDI